MFTRSGCIRALIVLILLICGVGALFYVMVINRPVVEETPTPSSYESQVRVGITGRSYNLPLYAFGDLLKGKAYEVVLVPVNDYDDCWERMAAGSLDMVIASLDAIALGLARHKAGVIVFKVAESTGVDAIVVRKNVTKPEELIGKKIAVVPGSTGYMLLTLFLDTMGRTTQECDILFTADQSQALEALLSGRADAAVLGDPHLQAALGKKCMILSSPGPTALIEEYCVVGNGLKGRHPDRVRDVVKTWFQVLAIIQKNPGLAKRIIGKGSGISPDVLGEYLTRIQFTDIADNKSIQPADVISKMKKFQNFWSLMGERNAHLSVDFGACIDLGYVGDLNEEDIESYIIEEKTLPPPVVTPSVPVTPVPSPSKAPGAPPSKTPGKPSPTASHPAVPSEPAPLPSSPETIEAPLPMPTLTP